MFCSRSAEVRRHRGRSVRSAGSAVGTPRSAGTAAGARGPPAARPERRGPSAPPAPRPERRGPSAPRTERRGPPRSHTLRLYRVSQNSQTIYNLYISGCIGDRAPNGVPSESLFKYILFEWESTARGHCTGEREGIFVMSYFYRYPRRPVQRRGPLLLGLQS